MAEREAADIAVQVRSRSVEYVPACRLPSASGCQWLSQVLETSIGIRAGLALAAALPELSYACGLNIALLADDLAVEPLIAVDGVIKVGELAVDEGALDKHRPNDEAVLAGSSRADAEAGRWVTPPRARG